MNKLFLFVPLILLATSCHPKFYPEATRFDYKGFIVEPCAKCEGPVYEILTKKQARQHRSFIPGVAELNVKNPYTYTVYISQLYPQKETLKKLVKELSK